MGKGWLNTNSFIEMKPKLLTNLSDSRKEQGTWPIIKQK